MLSKVISPARLITRRSHVVPDQLLVSELFFEVPLDHANRSAGNLQLFGRSVTKHERPIVPLKGPDATKAEQKPWLVYLEGGPGFGNKEPQESPITRMALSRGYQVLFLDYRGVGSSTPVSAATLRTVGNPSAQATYLSRFRQDSIVRDLEAVRACLTHDYPEEKKKWSIFGQSFGGFVSLTYLSFFPEGLREVFLTGGLAPVGKAPEQVYEATFRKVVERNRAYYAKFPEDVKNVRRIARFIQQQEGGRVALPGGGFLTVPRLLTLGLAFGSHGGLDMVHALILKMTTDLEQFGFLDRPVLTALGQFNPFDTHIIYAILHEAIYCHQPGIASNWAAFRVGKELESFAWLDQMPNLSPSSDNDDDPPLHFSGEMVFPLHFETYPELIPLKDAADILASSADWPALYDEDQLGRNEVPVYAASFIDDMYVDYGLARETAALIRGCKVFETNMMYHNALRAQTNEVMGRLFQLRDGSID
ncbi:alpha/beta-hydrolase [Sodiomyces alkalinus F11]|uniref:Alpha/beta-hydrolase n=1 Tax=Sodiomyces alkalinus (strain CBS 110278 / VKM F-3762 / F11) TaxID=1314773 RepID=A0A3N2PS00_SODAK|nr:alpha/beta-hydrolase [Sodiomyces alkalinus F11]ROT37291.1 alpha/beta-hydrolase [Sodiomyces alkalinus F11]